MSYAIFQIRNFVWKQSACKSSYNLPSKCHSVHALLFSFIFSQTTGCIFSEGHILNHTLLNYWCQPRVQLGISGKAVRLKFQTERWQLEKERDWGPCVLDKCFTAESLPPSLKEQTCKYMHKHTLQCYQIQMTVSLNNVKCLFSVHAYLISITYRCDAFHPTACRLAAGGISRHAIEVSVRLCCSALLMFVLPNCCTSAHLYCYTIF